MTSSFCLTNAFSQPNSKQCLTIDFESLPDNAVLAEGISINKQYFKEFGVTFELENGGIPVLAKVGSPTTAFSSNLGGDTPQPNQGIGKYFITDDGQTNNLTAIPLIVRFANPVDSVSAVVLDMDFDEIFTVDARDINDVPIFTKTIQAGDQGTGDGKATVFGFNLDGCEGAIYSLRFKGTRTEAGGFGFAMDNFAFCFSGIDIENNVSFDVKPTNCLTNKGSIKVINKGKKEYQYSVDGINFLPFSEIANLPAGPHKLTIIDDSGCSAEFDLYVDNPPAIKILNADIATKNTTCGRSNGVIDVIAEGSGLNYSFNNGPFVDSSSFENLKPGIYKVLIMDEYFCKDSFVSEVLKSQPVIIAEINTTLDFCEEAKGTATIKMLTTETYTYTLNGQEIEDGYFENIKAGDYTIIVKDNFGCKLDSFFKVTSTPPINLDNIASIESNCLQATGQISINAKGGTGKLNLFLDGVAIEENQIKNIPHGSYEIYVTDENGCDARSVVEVERGKCPIYIPNIISIQSLIDANKFFSLKTLEDYNAKINKYYIYDRWGSKIFASQGFSIHDQEFWWNGYFDGIPAETDVYTYLIEVLHPNGDEDIIAGSVTLLK
jgi:hypothetical protein